MPIGRIFAAKQYAMVDSGLRYVCVKAHESAMSGITDNMQVELKQPYPFADSKAARMLADGLRRASERFGLSQRQIARQLGHKQPVMLSHWATGRVPIPVERVGELATALDLDQRSFLLAVLHQRHPTVDWEELEDVHTPAYHFVSELQNIAGMGVEDFSQGQLVVMREAAADRRADRRWLTVHELGLIEMVRRCRPNVSEVGLSQNELKQIEMALSFGS